MLSSVKVRLSVSEPSPVGLLPVISKDGRTPYQAYARPFQANGKPRVALVVGGLGLNASATKAAIERLPPEVTLSFVPYADNLQSWIDQARAQGHEVLNPAEQFNGDTTLPLETYMRRDGALMLLAEAIVVMDDWETSGGAR